MWCENLVKKYIELYINNKLHFSLVDKLFAEIKKILETDSLLAYLIKSKKLKFVLVYPSYNNKKFDAKKMQEIYNLSDVVA